MASVNKKMETQGNMTNENKVIEQLWYTWSDVGIDRISAGFRIRAASEGLQDTRSELVQRLNPYQRYWLPRDANRSIDPNLTPICLALIDTGKERILVHKVYTGKDGVGRYGAFFIHLLENLPQEFSLLDAISLWQSPFWQRSDVKDRNTKLARVSLADLRQQQRKKRAFDPQTAAKIRKYLPSIIEAYLTKSLLREKQGLGSKRLKIYIAASDDDVALLISGLIHSLPAQLVQDLTFSTYEQNVNEATTEIVGTCWLSVREPEKNQIVAHLLPPHYYQERLAFNCYTGMCSSLVNHPQVLNHPLAAQCAHDATEYFLDRKGSQEFQDLLDEVKSENYSDLTVERFLSLNAKTVSRSDIEDALRARTLSERTIAARILSRANAPSTFLSLVLNVPGWWTTYKNALINLRQHSAQVPKLTQALTTLAQHALLPYIVDIAKRETTLLAKAVPPREVSADNEATFKVIANVMYCAAPPQAEPDVWRSLLKELLNTKHISHFFQRHWSIYTDLLKTWSSGLSASKSEDDNKLISDLFTRTLSWATFGDFLTLGLPLDWVEIATSALVYQPSSLSQKTVYHLEQKYHPDIKNLLGQLSQDNLRWSLATALFSTLITGMYPKKMSLLFVLLESPMSDHESTVNWLLEMACTTTDEIGKFFQHYGKKYITLYPRSSTLVSLFGSYAISGSELRIPLLNIWLTFNLQEEMFTRVVMAAHLTNDEKVAFLQYYGKRYLSLYPQSQLLASYVQEFLNFLWNAKVALFRGGQSPKEPSETERLLEFLYNFPQLSVPRELVHNWYNVARFVRQPSILKKEGWHIARGIGELASTPSIMGMSLLKELAVVCIANEHEVKLMIDNMSTVLTLPALVQLLYNIAESASDGIYRRQYEKTLYIPCIHYALGFKSIPSSEAQQEFSVQRFLDILLQDADEKTRKWLDAQTKHWSPDNLAAWQKYLSQHPPPIATSLFERIELFRERRRAFRKMRSALKHKGMEKILHVGTDYITTLSIYPKKVPNEYWHRLDEALATIDDFGKNVWENYETERHLPTMAQAHLVSNKPKLGRTTSWWTRAVVFTQVRLALRSGKIGRIVRVATEHMITLDRYGAKVPDKWWRQIDTAFDIFIALEVEYEEDDKNRDRERDIAAASQKLDELVHAKHPTPRLTMHEWRRIKAAVQYVANQEAQKFRDGYQ